MLSRSRFVLDKKEIFLAVGCYFPPSDKEEAAQWLVEQALRDKPAGSMPLVIGNLNANLDAPGTEGRKFWRRTWGSMAWGARHITSGCAVAGTCGRDGCGGVSRRMLRQ